MVKILSHIFIKSKGKNGSFFEFAFYLYLRAYTLQHIVYDKQPDAATRFAVSPFFRVEFAFKKLCDALGRHTYAIVQHGNNNDCVHAHDRYLYATFRLCIFHGVQHEVAEYGAQEVVVGAYSSACFTMYQIHNFNIFISGYIAPVADIVFYNFGRHGGRCEARF